MRKPGDGKEMHILGRGNRLGKIFKTKIFSIFEGQKNILSHWSKGEAGGT